MEHEVASFVVRCAKIRVGLNLMRLADMEGWACTGGYRGGSTCRKPGRNLGGYSSGMVENLRSSMLKVRKTSMWLSTAATLVAESRWQRRRRTGVARTTWSDA